MEAIRIGSVPKVLIVDARSYIAAVSNRGRGGGVECEEYYPNTEIVFMYLANIHVVRKSFHALRTLLNSQVEQVEYCQAASQPCAAAAAAAAEVHANIVYPF